MIDIHTPLGAIVTLQPAPEHLGAEFEGAGMLVIRMSGGTDHRFSSVLLSKENRAALAEALMPLPETVWGIKDTDSETVFRVSGEAKARQIAEQNAPALIVVHSLKTEWIEARTEKNS